MSGAAEEQWSSRSLLASVEDVPPVAAVDVLADLLARAVGARRVAFFIADLSGRSLVRLTGRTHGQGASGDVNDQVPLKGTAHGRALWTQEAQLLDNGEGHELVVPVTNRGDAIGVLSLTLDTPPGSDVVDEVGEAAHTLGYVLVANRRFSDMYEWGQRTTHFSLAAEIQRRLLPNAFTCEAGQATVAGWLEPAHDIGGDTFDYSLDCDTLHLSITDAMGHEVNGALLATLLVASLRNSRRNDAGLGAQAALANEALAEHADADEFVTGQLVRIDLATGTAAIVNAGHPHPLRLRGDGVETVRLESDLPFGIATSTQRVQQLELEAGDRLLFLTDGMIERNASDVDLPALVRRTRALHPREVVQELTQAVWRAVDGNLRDDATVLCVDWHGAGSGDRSTTHGANRGHASR